MKLRIVALGVRMPAWVDAAFDDYARRMPREFALELLEVKPEPRGRGRSVPQILAAEARLLTVRGIGNELGVEGDLAGTP